MSAAPPDFDFMPFFILTAVVMGLIFLGMFLEGILGL